MSGPANGRPRQAEGLQWTHREWLVFAAILYVALAWGLALTPSKLWEPRLHEFRAGEFEPILALLAWILTAAIVLSILLARFKHLLIAVPIVALYLMYSHYDRKEDLGIFLASIASATLALCLWVNFKWAKHEGKGRHIANIFLLAVIFLFSFTVYFFPNVRIASGLAKTTAGTQNQSTRVQNPFDNCPEGKKRTEDYLLAPPPVHEFVNEEHKKAVTEIAMRIEIDETWFNYKFATVGALFAAFLAYFSPFFNPSVITDTKQQPAEGNKWEELEHHIRDMVKTPVPSSFLGMVFVVSVAIDLHMRSNAIVTQQLGLWIKDFVECLVIPDNFIGWERFLRINHDDFKGLHMQFAFDLLHAVRFYFTSIILYLLYMSCLVFYLHVCSYPMGKYSSFAILLIFFLVHFSLLLFAVGGNTFPSALEVQLILWQDQDRWFSGSTGGVIPFMICLLISYLAAMRLFTLYYASKH